jgi:5-methylcytosine-specific restriction enzyme subunit McrC
MSRMKRTIVLAEYQPQLLPRDALSEAVAQRLWRDFSTLVELTFPSPKTDDQWQLTAQGWVGLLPVTPTVTLAVAPKTPIMNLLGMIEVAYGITGWTRLRGLVDAATVPLLYEGLARLLIEEILRQIQRGLYRPYQLYDEARPYLRGQLQIAEQLRRPPQATAVCRFHEPTVDVLDNQLLLWTLHRLLQSSALSGETTRLARRAYTILQNVVTLRPCTVAESRSRLYTRLNGTYAPLHALCAFFLAACGPSHLPGSAATVPFVVNMARLYEQFVAAWLRTHLPSAWQLQIQERHPLSEDLQFAIDLVLYHRLQQRPIAVLDTKYKTPIRTPDTADVAQVVAYAAAKGVGEAILIYPQPLSTPLNTVVGGVRVRTLAFALDGDLSLAGQQLLAALGLNL